MKRNYAIDLLRALMMLGIVLLHVFAQPERWAECHRIVYALLPCVVVFTFISGYYSIRFSWWKLVKLYGVALYGLAVVGLMLDVPVSDLICAFKAYWFLHAYAILVCFAPLINMGFDRISGGGVIYLPILAIVFGWGLLANMAFTNHFVPFAPELTAKSGVTLMGVYIAARFYRKHEERIDRLPILWFVVLLPVLVAICTIGLGWFGNYNSPIALAIAMCVFHLVKKIRLPQAVGRLAVIMAPSVFCVYILHANEATYAVLDRGVNMLAQSIGSVMLACILISILAFGACLLLDVPRRIGRRLSTFKF